MDNHTHIILFLFWTSLLLYVSHMLINMKQHCDEAHISSDVQILGDGSLDAFNDKDALFGYYTLSSYK